MKNNKDFEYNETIDNLTIYHSKAKDEPVMGSIVVGNLIFDIGASGSFVSLEIDNASDVFNIVPRDFSKIKFANIKSIVQNNAILLIYAISINNKEYERSLMIPKNKIQLPSIC